MKKHIDAMALAKILEAKADTVKLDYRAGFLAAARFCAALPAADVEPVRHGRWVWNPDGMDWGLGAWQCSECHMINPSLPCDKKVNVKLWAASHFCPCCGAKMDKGVV